MNNDPNNEETFARDMFARFELPAGIPRMTYQDGKSIGIPKEVCDALNLFEEHHTMTLALLTRLCYLEDRIENGELVPVRHGRWIDDMYFDEPVTRCTWCNRGFAKGHKAERFPYCPNCGAKQDLEVQDE